MPRKAPVYPGVQAPIQKKPRSTARAAAAAAKPAAPAPDPATLQQTRVIAYESKCQRAANILASKYGIPPPCADLVRVALQAAYAKLVREKDAPDAKLKAFMGKAKSNAEYRRLVTKAATPEEVENLVHRAMFERFAFASPEAQARYEGNVANSLIDSKVTSEVHATITFGTLLPMSFQCGKGNLNKHKDENLEDQRKSCT